MSINDQITQICKLIEKLKDSSFKSKIMIDARNLFYDETFEKRLNENRNLLIFNNGVYDLAQRTFRSGRPDDCMSFNTGINFVEYDESDPDVQRVLHVFRQIHPDPENFRFFFLTLAAGLSGIKHEQKLDIWTGSGSNGKSITIDFLSKSLGDYFDSPSITMLTRKRGSSSNASPDLAKLKGKRIVSFLEPEYDDTLHTSILKQFFGNDWVEARGLFKDPFKFKPQASGFLACNDLPRIPTNDGGTWRRIRVLEFKSKFVHGTPSKPNEYRADPNLVEQIDGLAEAFMSILIKFYSELYDRGFAIESPPDVETFTQKYQAENDVYKQYVDDCIDKAENENQMLKINDVWESFKVWFKDQGPNATTPSKKQVTTQIEAKLGRADKVGWRGYYIRPSNNNNDESDQGVHGCAKAKSV